MASAHPSDAGTVEFPEEFRAWLEFLEYADPDAFVLFQRQADVSLP
jgi:hypothetical protein